MSKIYMYLLWLWSLLHGFDHENICHITARFWSLFISLDCFDVKLKSHYRIYETEKQTMRKHQLKC
jgi:hypothetical protein